MCRNGYVERLQVGCMVSIEEVKIFCGRQAERVYVGYNG